MGTAKSHSPAGPLPYNVKSFEFNSNRSESPASAPDKTKVLSYNMATLLGCRATKVAPGKTRPRIDDGAPYSATGLVELKLLANQLALPQTWNIEPIPELLVDHSH